MRTLLRRIRRATADQRTALRNAYSQWRRATFRDLTVIAVTGSSGKSTTVGLLRTIIGEVHPVATTRQANGLTAAARLFRHMPRGTRHVVAEAGAGGTPDIAAIAAFLKPDVAVVTMVRLEHHARFRTVEGVAAEKAKLVEALPETGLAVLNGDDPLAAAMAGRTGARCITFGTQAHNDLRITGTQSRGLDGITVHVDGLGGPLTVHSPLFGPGWAVALGAAIATARALGMPDAAIVSGVAAYRGIITRCGIMRIPGGPVFILDTNKAPLHSVMLPMQALDPVEAPRKTIVIGQVSDYSGKSRKAYRDVVKTALLHADRVFIAGPTGTSWANPDVPEGKTFAKFEDILAMAAHLKETAMAGEVILLKSSSISHMERVALSFRDEVRCAAPACGIQSGCFACSLYTVPFHEQPRRTSDRRKLAARIGRPEDALMSDRPLGG